MGTLDVAIRRAGDSLVVDVESPAGDASGAFVLDQSEPWPERLAAAQRRSPDVADAQFIGRRLFDALFPTDVRERYRESLGMARQGGAKLALNLRCDIPDIAALPWELIWDPAENRFLAASVETAFCRYVSVPKRLPSPVEPPLRLLLVSSSPRGWASLDAEGELARVESALAMSRHVTLETRRLQHATPAGLRQALDWGPHLLHVASHGRRGANGADGASELVLEDPYGDAVGLPGHDLAAMLSETTVRVATLTACHTADGANGEGLPGLGPALVRAGLAGVISMQHELPDKAALEFSGALYRALAQGEPLGIAVNVARRTLLVAAGQDQGDWSVPVLHTREPNLRLVSAPGQRSPFHRRLPIMLAATALVLILALGIPRLLRAGAGAPTPTPVALTETAASASSTTTATTTPSPTATGAPATATAIPTELVYSNDFSNPEDGDFDTASSDPDHYDTRYDSGEYAISLVDPNWGMVPSIFLNDRFSPNATLAIDARLVGDVAGRQIEIGCRWSRTAAGVSDYRLVVEPATGRAWLNRFIDSVDVTLVGPVPTSALLADNVVNRLELSCVEDAIVARVNGVVVANERDDAIQQGALWFGVYADHATAEARFDNITITKPISSAASMSPTDGGSPPPPTETLRVTMLDNFDNPANAQLPTESPDPAQYRAGYDQGEYFIRQIDTALKFPGVFLTTAADSSITADVRLEGDTSGHYLWLGCRVTNADDGPHGYLLSLVPNPQPPLTGVVLLQRMDGGAQLGQALSAQTPAVFRGGNAINRVELRCVGTTISVRLNGAEVISVQEGTYQSGQLGFGVSSLPDAAGGAEGRFDNLEIREP